MRPELAVPVATSLSVPRWISYPVEPWPAVMPYGLLDVADPEVFRRRYRHRLHQRTPRILAELQERYAGWPLALCCYEPPGAFCHRLVLAGWITERIGEEVQELS
jgi:uncharacterized protein YeaO (DUF488 family)